MTKLDIQNTIKLLNQYKLSGVDENIGNMAKNRYGKGTIKSPDKLQSKEEKDFSKYKKISKSRSLYIRAFLINQGISHNRIKIETNEENVTKNWKNEVILNFIGV